MRPSKARAVQIQLELARIKSDYYSKGIAVPMYVRAALELELAECRAAKYDAEGLVRARHTQVLMVRSELLKKRLADVGMGHLLDDCLAEAEASVPKLEVLA